MLQFFTTRNVSLSIILILLTNLAFANQERLLPANDLLELTNTIRSEKRPLMLLFSARHCEYCERLVEEQLLPMQKNKSYDNQVIVREVKVDGIGYMHNFDGNQISYADFADLYEIDVTPTIVLLDDKGRMLSRRLVGYANPYFYSAYMDEHIQLAIKKLQRFAP